MPLFGTFSSASSRALGLRNGSPPLPPTISSPSDNATLTGSGNTTNRINTTVSFTSTVTSFAIDRFEFKVDQLDGSGNIVVAGTYQTAASAGATSFLISNLLTSTRYGLYMRTLDVAGLVSEPTSVVRFTTAAEVGPTAPTPSPSSTALGVSFAYSDGTAGTYAIGTREYSLHLTGSTASYVPFTGTVYDRRTTTNASGAALVPKTNYTVSFRYTASSPGVGTSTVSTTISTASETANSAPTVTINSQTTTNVTFTRGTSSGGTYGVSYYEYVIHNYYGVAVGSGTMSTATTSLNISAGVNPNEFFRVYVRAISLTSGAAGSYNYADGQLNPNTPSAPTVSFTMSANSPGTATLNITKPAYATAAYVNIVGYGIQPATDQGSYFSITLYYQPYNQVIEYKAYVINRLNAQSVYGNSIYWTTPKKDVAKVWKGSDFGQIYYSNYTYVIPTNACEPARLAITFGSSGIGATPNDVGYQRVDSISATFKCGIKLTRPSDATNFDRDAICNITTLRFSFSTIGNEVNQDAAKPEIYGGLTTLGATDSLLLRSVSVGGTALHNKVFFATSTAGKSWNSGCVLSTAGDYFAGKAIELTGVETTPGSFS